MLRHIEYVRKVVFFHSNTQVMQTSGMVVRESGTLAAWRTATLSSKIATHLSGMCPNKHRWSKFLTPTFPG